MGADSSRPSSPNRNQRQRQRQGDDGIPAEEVNRLLRQQQMEYEKKLQTLQVKPSAPNHKGAEHARETNQRNVDNIPGLRVSPNLPSPQSPYRASPQPGTSAAFIPPSHTPRVDNRVKSPQNLYPTLETTTYFNRAQNQEKLNNVPVTFSPSNQEGFVMVGHTSSNAQGFGSPSAPPVNAARPNTSGPQATSRGPRKQPGNNHSDGFNCKTCGKLFGMKIFNCLSGHGICSDCKERQVPCGVCGTSISDVRNRGIEDMVAEKTAPCPNAAQGCKLSFKQVDVEAHLKECPFSDLVCPLSTIFGRCPWRGMISQMASHFDDFHSEHRQGKVDTEMFLINILDNHHTVHFVDIGPWSFLVHIKVDEGKRNIYMTVQFMGTQISATKWTYEVHVYNKRESRRKYFYTDVCNSFATPVEQIFADAKCMVIPQSYALTYINEGCLAYKFYIKRENNYDSEDNNRGRGFGNRRGRGRGRGAKANS